MSGCGTITEEWANLRSVNAFYCRKGSDVSQLSITRSRRPGVRGDLGLVQTAPSQPGMMSSPQTREMMPKQHPPGIMPMAGHPGMGAGLSTPRMVGQDAFGAIREIVRILDADPKTDWSKVDLEALRQHLIDMNEVNATAMSGSRRTSKSSTEIPNASAAASTAAKLITLTPGSSVKTVAGAGAFTTGQTTTRAGAYAVAASRLMTRRGRRCGRCGVTSNLIPERATERAFERARVIWPLFAYRGRGRRIDPGPAIPPADRKKIKR